MNLGDSSYKLIHGLSRLVYCKICHICGCEGDRQTQGLFVCTHCGEYNADLNGAINIAKKFERSLGYMPLDGVSCEHALNHVENMEAPPFKVG
jgi:hypothetical protein